MILIFQNVLETMQFRIYILAMMNNTTVVMGSAAPAVSVVRFGESPVMMTCPTCRNTITTNTSRDVGGMAWLLCLVLFFVG